MASDKPHLNLVIIGHVDHGKSTLVGRILLETGQFPAHMVEKYKVTLPSREPVVVEEGEPAPCAKSMAE